MFIFTRSQVCYVREDVGCGGGGGERPDNLKDRECRLINVERAEEPEIAAKHTPTSQKSLILSWLDSRSTAARLVHPESHHCETSPCNQSISVSRAFPLKYICIIFYIHKPLLYSETSKTASFRNEIVSLLVILIGRSCIFPKRVVQT